MIRMTGIAVAACVREGRNDSALSHFRISRTTAPPCRRSSNISQPFASYSGDGPLWLVSQKGRPPAYQRSRLPACIAYQALQPRYQQPAANGGRDRQGDWWQGFARRCWLDRGSGIQPPSPHPPRSQPKSLHRCSDPGPRACRKSAARLLSTRRLGS
jgi:hypothetical protein